MSGEVSKKTIGIGFGILFFIVFMVIMMVIILKPGEKKKNNNKNNVFRKGGNNEEESDTESETEPKTEPKTGTDPEIVIKPPLKIKIQLDTESDAETPSPISIFDVGRNKLIHYISQNVLHDDKFKDADTQYEATSSVRANALPNIIKVKMTGDDKVCFRKIQINNKFYTKRGKNSNSTIGCLDGSNTDSEEEMILYKYTG